MKKFEYLTAFFKSPGDHGVVYHDVLKVQPAPDSESESTTSDLSDLGAAGWELVAAEFDRVQVGLGAPRLHILGVFKREVEEKPAAIVGEPEGPADTSV